MSYKKDPNYQRILETSRRIKKSVSAMHGAGPGDLKSGIDAFVGDERYSAAEKLIFFVETISEKRICKNKEGFVFDCFMENENLSDEWKAILCNGILNGEIFKNNTFPICSNFDKPPYNRTVISERQLREKVFLESEGNLLVMTVKGKQFKGAFTVFYRVDLFGVPDSLPRYAVRWEGLIRGSVKRTVKKYYKYQQKQGHRDLSHFFVLGALDLLEHKTELFRDKEIKDILEGTTRHSLGQVRKRAYQVGAGFFGMSFLENALDDPNQSVRRFAEKYMSGEYNPKGGRPKQKDSSQLTLL